MIYHGERQQRLRYTLGAIRMAINIFRLEWKRGIHPTLNITDGSNALSNPHCKYT